jgi:hypothetical protein
VAEEKDHEELGPGDDEKKAVRQRRISKLRLGQIVTDRRGQLEVSG